MKVGDVNCIRQKSGLDFFEPGLRISINLVASSRFHRDTATEKAAIWFYIV